MANTVQLHRALALNDSDDTQLFTFLLSIGDVENFRQNPARSSLFYYQGHEWYLTCGGFDGKDGIPQLGVFLYWTGTNTAGLRCRTDYRIIVRNVQDPAESLISEGLQVLFNPPKSLGWGKRELGPLSDILSVSKGFIVDPNGSLIVELALKSGKTIFEQTVDISQILEEPKQEENPFKSYFTPNFSLAGFEFYLSVYPFGDREEAGGHVSMYLHRYVKTGNPHLGCRIRYRFFIGGHVSPGDSKTFEFSFKNDHGYGRFKAFEPLSSTDLLRRGPVPVGVEILSITSYAQLELPLTTRGYYHTDNFVFEDVVFGDHRGNQWKLSVNNTSQNLCFRLDAEDKNKLHLKTTEKKEERCSKYLQSQILVQSRADKKKTVSPVGGPTTAYFSASLPDKGHSIASPISISKAKALDGEYCTKEEPSLSVRVELLNVQDLPGIMKDYPVLEFERFRLYHTREGLRKCLEQNEQMRQEMEKLRQQLSLTASSAANRNQIDDLNSMFPKPFEDGTLHVITTSLGSSTNQSLTFPALSPVAISSASSSFPTLTASATATTTLSTTAAMPRTHSPTTITHSPTPTAESSGPAQFVLLPGEDDPADNGSHSVNGSRASATVSSKNGVPTPTSVTGMGSKANVAQSYVGIVTAGPTRAPITSVSNASTSQIKLPGVDIKPKTPIAQSYVGIVTPTTRTTSTPAAPSATSITSVPKIHLQPGMDIKPKTAIAQSYVGIVNAPVSAPKSSPLLNRAFDNHTTASTTTINTDTNSRSHSYHREDLSAESKSVHAPVTYMYNHHRNSYAEALSSGEGGFDSSDFGIPSNSDLGDSLQSLSSADLDIVSGDNAPQKRVYTVEQRLEPPSSSNIVSDANYHANHVSDANYPNTKPISIARTNSDTSSSSSYKHMEESTLKTSHSQKSVQFATELTKEYRVNTKKPISKSKTPVNPNGSQPTKPILAAPKSSTTQTTTLTFTSDTRPSRNTQTQASSQPSNQKPSLANKAWAKPTIFTQIAAPQEKGSPSVERKPVPQIQVSQNPKPQAYIITTGQAPAPQTMSYNSIPIIQEPTTNSHLHPSQSNTLPHNWTPGFQSQASDSSNPSLEDLHLYTMPDLDIPPALPPRNGEKRREPSRILTTLGSDPTLRGSPRSSSSLPRSSAFGPPLPQRTGLERRTLSNQALAGQRSVARGSPTTSIETQVSTRRDLETTFGTVAETAQTSRQLPQAQVAHMVRRTNSDGSHVGIIETNL